MTKPLAKRIYGGQSAAERAAQRRQQLLDAGLQIIGHNGYQSARITDICRAAGVSQRYFYEAFKDSEQLLIDLYQQELEKLAQALTVAFDKPHPDPEDSIRQALVTFLALVHRNRPGARIIFFELHGVSSRTRDVYLAGRRRVREMLVGYLTPLVGNQLSGEEEIEMLAVALVGALIELTRSWLDGDFGGEPEAVARQLMAVIGAFAGLETTAGAPT